MLATYDIPTLLSLAEDTAVAAGNLAYTLFHQPRQIEYKGFRDLVTDADIVTQKLVTDTILAAFPTYGFLTEEEDETLPATGDVIWIIDPIDGTTNYSRQLPNFTVSLGAFSPDFKPLAGAIYDPAHRELFSAGSGLGATSQLAGGARIPLHVSDKKQLPEAMLLFDWSADPQRRQRTLSIASLFSAEVFSLRSFGSAALALAWVAAGRIDVYFNFTVKRWDLAAAAVLIDEAGGTLTTFSGEALDWWRNDHSCLASNGRVANQFIDIVEKQV